MNPTINITKYLVLLISILLIGCSGNKGTSNDAEQGTPDKQAAPASKTPKVTAELFVMSKCPYGVQAVDGFIPVLDTFKGEVDLEIDYIGRKGPDGSLSSMHGEEEVQGNIIQLCAKEIAPQKYVEYLTCVNKQWRTIPANWETCAKEVGITPNELATCKDGDKGQELLKASFMKAMSKGAKGSPTIYIGGMEYSGGRAPKDFERFICSNFGESKSIDYCKELPPPPKVTVTAITDKRCGEKCDPSGVIKSLQTIFYGLEPKVLDWNDPGTQELCKAAGIKKLPAIFFDDSIEADKEGYEHMQKWLEKAGQYYVLKVQPVFDPLAEICDNKQDDTNDGLVDCDDPSCKNAMACREETDKSLEVFVMSQCPYGAMALEAMTEVLDAFGKDMDFTVHFIADKIGDEFDSMHGPEEVAEDIRQICAAKHYKAKNKYLDYLWCRYKDYRNPDWKACATNGINANVIEKCATGEEGKKLLSEDIAIAKGLEINGSPTWVVNGQTKFSGITPDVIQKNFCEKNPGLAGCEKKLSGQEGAPAPQGSCGGK